MKKTKNVKKKLVAQTEPLFGFFPIYGLKSRIHDTSKNDVCNNILQLHNELRKDGRYNYRGLQIPIHSKLNFQKWGDYLKQYWDWELPLPIKYGFPLDFDRKTVIVSEEINHKSATEYPSHVDTYLAEEIEHGAMGVLMWNHLLKTYILVPS